MKRLLPLPVVLLLLAFSSGCVAPDDPPLEPQRPNIVLIMADDMGYSDIGAFGGEIRTPNLDRLAADGLRFTAFYNAGRCCPTRAALLTGRYPHEVGMGAMVSNVDSDPEPGPYQGYVDTTTVTIADALRDAGYATYMSGKWHVGEKPAYWPRRQGFDRYFGLISGASSYFEIITDQPRVRRMVHDDTTWMPPADGFYMTDAITDSADAFLQRHAARRPADPFFLYVAYTAPHWPLHALPEDIARYEGRYDDGWDRLRDERYARMLEAGLIDSSFALSERPSSIPAWADAEDQADWARRMAVYAAMVDRMDQGIGQLLGRLDAMGELDNTLVLFLSDNGASPENITGRELNDPSAEIGSRGSYVAYREPWANASNTPFRRYKAYQHEGGIRTPFIAHWPEGIDRPGRLVRRPGHIIDVMATALDLADAPAGARQGYAGYSLQPAFGGDDAPVHETLYFEHIGHRAIRQGDWKLVAARGDEGWELYNLAEDPTETRNLIDAEPARAAALQAAWTAWADSVGVRER